MSGDDGRSPADNFITTHLIDIPRTARHRSLMPFVTLMTYSFLFWAEKNSINQHDAHVRPRVVVGINVHLKK